MSSILRRSLVLGVASTAIGCVAGVGPTAAALGASAGPAVVADAAALPALTLLLQSAAPEFPGAAFAVVCQSRGFWQGAIGVADVETGAPMTAQTPISVYSVNKSMTATLAMQLVELGQLDLDRPIGNIADVPAQFTALTARELLTHTSGIRHYRDREWIPNARGSCSRPIDGLAAFVRDPLGPRGAYLYSSFGYVLLSLVLEGASGKSFSEMMTSQIFSPAGMSHASLWQPGQRRPPNGHEKAGTRFRAARSIDNSCKFGAGALIASAEDLARFGSAFAGGRLVSESSRLAMTADTPNHYGLGWGVGALAEGGPIAAHSGSAIGGTSAIVIDLERGIAVGVVGNAEGPSLIATAKAILVQARRSRDFDVVRRE